MFSNRKTLVTLVVCLSVILAMLLGVLLLPGIREHMAHTNTTAPTTGSTAGTTITTESTTDSTPPPTSETTQTTESTAPPVVKLSTATIAAVGDFLMHLPVTNSADIVDGNYDFANVFTYFGDYVAEADYAVGNLESTMAGPDYRFWYKDEWHTGYYGYPVFNCPDGIVPSLQAAGFDMLLTANNHSYDTRATGFHRTQQILQAFEMDYLGTVDSPEKPLWRVQEINGIRIGMLCYTYDTDEDPNKVALNGIPVSQEDGALIGTFSYGQLDVFYENVAGQMEAMEAAGAEAVVLFIHWGNEYQLKQNKTQSAIAQALCDLGVDVIVGGHPHVVQPIELLTSTVDETHKTVCLYSTGNILSNQRVNLMTSCPTGHTEDGVMFSFTFAKYSDGTVILEDADLLPTWVDMHYNSETGKNVYSILPLDDTLVDWVCAFDLSENRYQKALDSYSRTMAIVGEGLAVVQEYLADFVADTEAALGVQN